MPRTRRHWVPTAGAHLISRFVDRRYFLVDDVDRQLLLDAIGRAHERWDWKWLCWALMSSHTHYGTVAGHLSPSPFFRSAHTRFARRFHDRRDGETLGPVFADRPTIYAVKPSRLSRMVAYHHRNPVAAGVVLRASSSTWTSHRVFLRLDPAPRWFDVEWALDVCGFRDTAAGRQRFDDFVMEVALDDAPWTSEEPGPRDRCVDLPGDPADLHELIRVGRELGCIGAAEPVDSRTRPAVRVRVAIARVATDDLGIRHVEVARRLGVTAGALSNALARLREDERACELTARLREQWGSEKTT